MAFLEWTEVFGPHTLPGDQGARPKRNPRDVFRPRHKPGFGRKGLPRNGYPPSRVGKFGPALGGVGVLLGLAEWADDWNWYEDPFPWKVEPDWVLVEDCSGRLPDNPPPANYVGPYWELYSGTIANCNGGQVPAADYGPWVSEVNLPDQPAKKTLFLSAGSTTPALRMRHDRTWNRTDGDAGRTIRYRQHSPLPPGSLNPPAEPNMVRASPGYPVNPSPAPEAPVAVPYIGWQSTPPGQPPAPTHSSRPPRKGEKERKTRSKQILIWLFRFLDTLSELSEILDSFYEALPDDVKDRWEKGRGSRGFLDNAGQYGIDGADWKVQALWHNWHRVDTELALRNIARNSLQDELYGLLHKGLPPGAYRASGEPGSEAWYEWTEATLDAIFLE
jgi:hypothetical protein